MSDTKILLLATPSGKRKTALIAGPVFVSIKHVHLPDEGITVPLTEGGFSTTIGKDELRNAFDARFLADVVQQWQAAHGKTGWKFVGLVVEPIELRRKPAKKTKNGRRSR